eukprot:CAMPEP_0118914048 /NCGR_PEP_ID=MMETSP1166-20130328/14568_1 /TAXON_ID=1104430 /ORGANISM="Chrysoreinhardia sp, Strain CCMP3193" /LENGTH=99 /DNA_ID=CAMNT_0006853613 /DNA_START=57 /DNA_END=356 /DNA_ORIENTATION=-
MAFRASLRRLGEVKEGVQPHLYLWWKKKPTAGVQDGMVTRTISPFELKPLRGLYDLFSPQNIHDQFPSLWDVGPALALLVGTVYGADWYFDYLARQHRD